MKLTHQISSVYIIAYIDGTYIMQLCPRLLHEQVRGILTANLRIFSARVQTLRTQTAPIVVKASIVLNL